MNVIIAGENRYPLALDRILYDLVCSESLRKADRIIVSTWDDQLFGPLTEKLVQTGSVELILSPASTALESPAPVSFMRQAVLLEKATDHLNALAICNESYVLKLRPDLYGTDLRVFSYLVTYMFELSSTVGSSDLPVIWTCNLDPLEPFYACDMLYCATLEAFTRVRPIPNCFDGLDIQLMAKRPALRIEAFFFSQMYNYVFEPEFLELLSQDYYRKLHNTPDFSQLLRILVSESRSYRATLRDWLQLVKSIKIGLFHDNLRHIFLLRRDNNHRPITSEANHMDNLLSSLNLECLRLRQLVQTGWHVMHKQDSLDLFMSSFYPQLEA